MGRTARQSEEPNVTQQTMNQENGGAIPEIPYEQEQKQAEGQQGGEPNENSDSPESLKEPEYMGVIWLKNVRHYDGLHRKGEKSSLPAAEANQLIAAKLVRLPE